MMHVEDDSDGDLIPVEDDCPHSDDIDIWGAEDPFPGFSFTSDLLAQSPSPTMFVTPSPVFGSSYQSSRRSDYFSAPSSPSTIGLESADSPCDSDMLCIPSPEHFIAPIITFASDVFENATP